MFGQEVTFNGQSVGKFITKTKVVSENGHIPTYKTLAIRNMLRLVPFDQFSFFGDLGWYDKWSNTRVVDIKGFERDKQENREKEIIDQIGNKEV